MARYSKKKMKRSKKHKNRKRSRKIRGGQGNPVIFNFYTKFRYGDNILSLKFFYNIAPILKKNNIVINYYYDGSYITNVKELERYVDPATLKISALDSNVSNLTTLAMENNIEGVSFKQFDKYFSLFYQSIVNTLGLQNLSIDTSLYQKEDYLLDIYNKLDPKYHDLDILFINSKPNSNQFNYDKDKMDALCIRLGSKYKVATTTKVNDSLVCTMDDGLMMQDIGAISTHAKYMIVVHTGPLMACFNIYTKKTVKKWFIFWTADTSFAEINNEIMTDTSNLDSIDSQIILDS